MKPNDVLGLTLDVATEKLNKLNIKPKIFEIEPLRFQHKQEGIFRVVKQTKNGNDHTLILCKIPDMKGVSCHTK